MRGPLVAYASKMGSTKEIAKAVAGLLTPRGLPVAVRDVATVESVADYAAVVFGSAVYSGRWRSEAVRFVRRHENALAARPHHWLPGPRHRAAHVRWLASRRPQK
jgi:menaquinone-dependent protoporphyrinogen oxidase